MVALNVPRLGGLRKPSLCAPLLFSAHDDLARGCELSAAVKLLEAMRRYLLACCEFYACTPHAKPTPRRMLRALEKAEANIELCFMGEIIEALEAHLRLEETDTCVRCCLDFATDLISPEFDCREGGEL